jgi:hypothetical protein
VGSVTTVTVIITAKYGITVPVSWDPERAEQNSKED